MGDALRSGFENDGPPQAQATDSLSPMPSGGYLGADSSTARTSFLGFPTNSLTETSRWTRVQMTQKVRALQANLPLIQRIISKIGQHSVGKGIFVRPTTKDTAWNEEARRLFEEWASNPGVYSIDASRDHYQDQRLAAETMVGDGEYFAALVKTENGAPMIQPFDVFEVESPDRNSKDAPLWVDGVRPNPFMRPVGYSVRELQTPGRYEAKSFREIPADSMIHVFDRMRAKQMRGLTWFHAGINQGIDALDLRSLVTGTAKLHEALAVTVKKSGKLNRKGALDKIRSSVTDGTPADDDFKALEKVYGGGLISYMGTEGEVNLVASNRPSQNIREFILHLYADIAAATRLPYEVVMSLASLGGATARGALEDAQWMFEMVQDRIIWAHSYPIYRWRIAKFMQEGRLPKCKDPSWWNCSWRGPAKLTVDMGRTADANLKLLKGGALSYSRYYEERALEARDEWAQQIQDLKWLDAECAKNGIEPSRIIEPTPGTVNLQMPETANQ